METQLTQLKPPFILVIVRIHGLSLYNFSNMLKTAGWSFTDETDLLKWLPRLLTVIDNYMLAEPNDLETEFAATVSKIQDINSESCFYAKIAYKYIKQKED